MPGMFRRWEGLAMRYPKNRIKLSEEIYNIIYQLAYIAEKENLIDPSYCIASVASEKITKLVQNNYRRRVRK